MNPWRKLASENFEPEYRFTLNNIVVATVALLIGTLAGPLQALDKANIDLYQYLPFLNDYYQDLTIHGVLNVLVWTTFFITGFLAFLMVKSLDRPFYNRGLMRTTFGLMLGGTLATAAAILSGNASVLYTAYPPLQAHPAFYIGLTLVVVGTWIVSIDAFLSYRAWRREHPDERTPLLAFGTLVVWAMWDIASLGLAVEFVGLLIPWSLGWVDGTSPLLARALFWFTGHPIVYFWLLPAYISWYFMLPAQVDGKLFSESMARLALLLFIPFSIPVGVHHMFTDPGIALGLKWLHTFFTFAVFFPSALTAFTVLASVEIGGRNRGGKGIFGWIGALPWKRPAAVAQLLAMVLFALGGVSGLINASNNLNMIVHNTLWVPGHFHLTVGTAVTLTFMGISYWLIPHLTGRALWSRRIALWQAWTWFAGMALMGRGLHWMGLNGAPRRTLLSQAPEYMASWQIPGLLTAVGGVIAFISLLLYIYLIVMSLVSSRSRVTVAIPVAVPVEDQGTVPVLFDRLRPWVVATVILAVIAWAPLFYNLVSNHPFSIPGIPY